MQLLLFYHVFGNIDGEESRGCRPGSTRYTKNGIIVKLRFNIARR